MRTHTSEFKDAIKTFGRELDNKITYTINGVDYELGGEELNSVTPHFESQMLKSAMRGLDIDSNVEIPVGTIINYKFGVKTRSGKNIFDGEIELGGIDPENGQLITNNSRTRSKNFIKVNPNTIYTITRQNGGNRWIVGYNENKEGIIDGNYGNYASGLMTLRQNEISKSFQTSPTTYYIKWYDTNNTNISEKVQIEQGDEATEYEEFGMYDYINYGDYIVKESEKQEDLRSYKITCYDFMLKSMVDYESMEITYPITVRNYLNAICTHLGLNFKNASDTFANYDKEIPNELYLDETGASLGYTFRDVLDELAQVTGSIICIDQETGQLEIRYVEDTEYEIGTASGTIINLEDATGKKINELKANKVSTQDATPTPDYPQEVKTIKNNININISDGTITRNYLIPLGNNEIAGIGEYLDELIVDKTGHVYLNKKIGKVVLDGNETWSKLNLTYYIKGDYPQTLNALCSRFIKQENSNWSSSSTYYKGKFSLANAAGQIKFMPIDDTITTTVLWKNWLSTHNTEVYYALAQEELIDLQTTIDINLFEGINHITTSENMDLSLKYYTQEIKTDIIDEEYLKDVNVNFGEKFGPINTIVLSRAGGSDSIYYPRELPENPIEIKIEENQIMNFNNRDEFMPDIYEKLNGLEYYTNDYVSTGICYYDIGDRYIVSIDGINYSCVMFNDETNITQGLVENIYTDMPDETNTDYTKADKTDRKINQTYIIANKQQGQIEALTSRTTTLEDKANNTYTIEQVNQLIQTAETGITNTFSEAGGNNIFRNTGLWFETNDNNNPYEFWTGVVVRLKEEKANNMSALLLQNTTLEQEQFVPNGTYTISFKYKKIIILATCKVIINDIEYTLEGTEDTEFVQIIDVKSQHINIKFVSDVNNSCEIYNLMVNSGDTKLAYSQNQNETTTDTVNISKGITITSSELDTVFKANADGTRVLDKSGNTITQFTDTGITTKKIEADDNSQISGLLIKKVGNHTWMVKI